MAALLLLGCLLVAYSIPLSVFFLVIVNKPQLVVIVIASSFFWLCSFVLTTILWSIFTLLHSVPFLLILLGTILQEIARLIFVRGYFVSSRGFSVVGLHALLYPLSDLYAALSGGVGFGLIQISVIYGPLFFYAGEFGSLFDDNCPQFSLFTLSAWNGCLFGFLQLSLMIQAFDAMRRMGEKKLQIGIVRPFFFHLSAASITIFNTIENGCIISLPLLLLLTVFSSVTAVLMVMQPDYASKKRL